MLQVQDLSYTFNKDNIVNYERKLIQSPFESLPKPVGKNQSKYSVCQLNSKVQELVNDAPYNLRWIGNASSSAISAYIYCLLMLSVGNDKNLMQFKSVFYELCRKYLDVKEQKLLIEFLCLLQFSSDKFLFLKKYPLIDSIIFSVFDKLQAEQNYYHDQEKDSSQQITDFSRFSSQERVSRSIKFEMEDSTTGQLFQMNKLAELYSKFGSKFHFLKWTKSSQSSFLLTIDESKKMYIIAERQYFFVLQILENTEIKSTKSKLTKGDRIQVEMLLSYSQTESQTSFQQKLNQLSQYVDKNCLKSKQDPFNTKNTIDSDSNRKDILVCNPKNHTAVQVSANFKKEFKFSYFTKKVNSKVEEIHESIINPKEGPKRQLDYIDLMESSFEEEKAQEADRMRINKQVQESHSLKFYTPKFLMKPLNSPTQMKKKKKSFDQKANKTEVILKKGRSPSEAQKKYVPIFNGEKDKKSLKSKEMKFYSPPKHFGQSPEKKNAKKVEIEQKKVHDTESKDKHKEDLKYFGQKHNEKREQIHKNHVQKETKSHQNNNISKIQTSFSYNPKIFNNRISLQSRKDLDLLAKYKLPTQDLMLNRIPQVDRSQEVSRRQLFEKKKIIREELSQSLNNKSEVLLKKRHTLSILERNSQGKIQVLFQKVGKN